ncbi:DUF1707 domain-containing protein [Mycobacterium sp. 21AC1]|uniref:DUF1707 SHOCT-like domain-containing protein n=1 Tax=[Mycobacterium] appelbergii TaxID=2939269 RepID=UPI0029391AEB|nr:DUF1707 domain-containing protein [Mycobacterium sp. 21AC1]MDV3123425.1 DUF1707 domain-containing protein [Mycobacterium sp. 21AC1]
MADRQISPQRATTRARDSDRNDTCKVLDSALSEGQLTMEEHRQRVSSATNAATLGELAGLVEDLQNSNAPVQLPSLKQAKPLRSPGTGWGLRLAAAAVLVLLGIGIGWGLYGTTSSPLSRATDPGAQPDGIAPKVLTPPRQLQSLAGFTGLFEQMRQKFGSTMGYELDIHADTAYLDRPDPQDNRRMLDYDYRGGWGDPGHSTTTVDADDRLVDLSKFDYEKTLGTMRGAPETLGMKRADVTDTWLRLGAGEDPANPEALNVEIVLNSDFGVGRIELYPDGSTKAIWPVNP